MASYSDIINVTMQNQKINFDRRGAERPGTAKTDTSFDKLLTRSLEGINVPSIGYSSNPPSIIAQSEIEDELKFRECLKFVLGQEGSKYVADDGGKESSRYGILQSTARAFGYKGDLKKISKTEVEGIYKKIWNKSGAGSLPYPMSLVHFDTYVNSPASARRLLKKSGGNLEVYLKSREQRYTRIAEARPDTYGKYLKGWKSRINSLKNVVAECSRLNKVAAAGPYGTGESANI
jgi:hypothetical protein